MSLKMVFKATKCPVREPLFLAGGGEVFGCITIKFT